MEKYEKLAHKLHLPLIVACGIGTVGIQSLEHMISLPSPLMLYGNTCGDYIYVGLCAALFRPKGAIVGTALCIAAEIIPTFPLHTPDVRDIPAAIVGGIVGYFDAKYHRRENEAARI